MLPPLKNYQTRALEQAKLRIQQRTPMSWVLYSPTGGGKTRMMIELCLWSGVEGIPVVLYTNRRMLLEQTADELKGAGIAFGVRAAGYAPEFTRSVQLSMLQTDISRCLRTEQWQLHHARLALIDEAHNSRTGQSQEIIRRHKAAGCPVVGVTASPVEMGHEYEDILCAGTNSELRDEGMLVWAKHYGCTEADLGKVGNMKVAVDECDVRKAVCVPAVVGKILDHYHELNPERRPTLGFGPGVEGSLYLAQEFTKAGVRTAHIDGDDVWVDGELHTSSHDIRNDVKARLIKGDLQVVFNRFVLREGVNIPQVSHGILATTFGSVQSYVQACGRLLRTSPGKECATIQDHGGNWWRHGSINQDWEWNHNYSPEMLSSMRAEAIRSGREPEPICCPRCHALRLSGPACLECGFTHDKSRRYIIQHNGRLSEHDGQIFKPRRRRQFNGDEKTWTRMYHRAKRAGMTFLQAEALFAKENHWTWPRRDMCLMPKRDLDWHRRVADVPVQFLSTQNEATTCHKN